MIEAQIAEALTGIEATFDSRVQFCALEVGGFDGEQCTLAGRVLDEQTLTAVSHQLSTQFPSVTFDKTAVEILYRPNGPRLTVCTNLAGLHRRPARITEMLSELLNGALVEPLFAAQGWAFVRQQDGYLGWVNAAYLGEWPEMAATYLVSQPVSLLHEEPRANAPLVSRVLAGTAVAPETFADGWAKLTLAGGQTGWLPQADLRALDDLPRDEDGRRQQIVSDACQYVGVPYRWAGCSVLGIDCSGLSQLLHRLVGITLPRDADMQLDAGKPVEPPFQPGDLLFFGSSGGHRKITHVAVSVGGWHVIHSSGSRNGVYRDDVQAVDSLHESFVGACTYL
jgi:gamma-D-glutamyl-L-lysine dipeptidyl-peptidase